MNKPQKIATVTLNPAIDQTIAIPGFQAGKVNRVEGSRSDPGGKGVNVASILADCGFAVTATGFLGRDNPHLFEGLFAKKTIEDRFVRISGSTRIGLKIIDEVNRVTTDINFSGQRPSDADLHTLVDVVEHLAADCQWFVLSGSLPPGVPPEMYASLIRRIQSKGKRAALDTSGKALACALEAVPALVKPNIDELEELLGRRLTGRHEILAAARSLVDRGIETVVVSMGAAGAFFAEKDNIILVKPPHVAVKSTVGAGDAMLGGMVAGKARGLPLTDCARLATAFALGTITRIGSGISSLAQIKAFMKMVSVEMIAPH